MRNDLLALSFSLVLLSGCSSNVPQLPQAEKPRNALCAELAQRMDHSVSANANPGNGVVTAAEYAHLIKKYNQLGCNMYTDKAYRNPNESLPMNPPQ